MKTWMLLGSLLVTRTVAWTLQTSYTSNNYADFFDKFSFWTAKDPTDGTVDYVSQKDAWANGLIGNGGNIYIGVDDKNRLNNGEGRKAIRLTSKEQYQSGTLVVVDITHMPGGICGTWPAFWTTAASDDWPQQGEIDIIEQANNAQYNQMSLHVSQKQGSCHVDRHADMTATKDRWGDCTQEGNDGCDANDTRKHSFGSVFNRDGGGVYAMEWTSTAIRIWFFPRSSIPLGDHGPLGASPDPSQWGAPATSFEGPHCDFNAHVRNQRIVINTTFCGHWGSGSWSSSGCATSTGYKTCEAFVRASPWVFKDAFWTIYSLNVFRQ